MDVEWEDAYVVCGHPILILMSIARSVTWTNANEEPDCVWPNDANGYVLYDIIHLVVCCLHWNRYWKTHSFTHTHTFLYNSNTCPSKCPLCFIPSIFYFLACSLFRIDKTNKFNIRMVWFICTYPSICLSVSTIPIRIFVFRIRVFSL